MAQDMPPPPEAEAIRLARMAARLTVAEAAAKVRAAGGQISDTYWRDVERGHGGRRGRRVLARAADERLAQMADAVGLSPERLREAARGHPEGEDRARVVEKAARVLEEMQRRKAPPPRLERRGGIFPQKLMEQLDLPNRPQYAELRARAEVAAAAHGVDPNADGATLEGAWVFPNDSDPESERQWDGLTALGYTIWEVMASIAGYRVMQGMAREQQGRDAAGLARAVLSPDQGQP